MKESLNYLIQWAVKNRFDIESQDGTKLVVVDYEELIKVLFVELALAEEEK